MNIEAMLKRKFGKFRKVGNGSQGVEYLVKCPFCVRNGKGNPRKLKLSINPTRNGGVYKCWVCKESGGLGRLLGVALVNTAPAEPSKPEPLPDSVRPPGYMRPINELAVDHPAIQYLTYGRSRSFDPDELSEMYGVMYCETGEQFGNGETFAYHTTNTIVTPIWYQGKVVGWQSRLMTEPEKMSDMVLSAMRYPKDEDDEWILPPKYFTSPGFPKGRVFFNWDVAIQHDILVVCEGVFDVFAVGGCGIAALGKSLHDQQIQLLKNSGKHVVLLLDEDAAEEAMKLRAELITSVPVTLVTLPDGQDAGDMERGAIHECIVAQMERDYLARSNM